MPELFSRAVPLACNITRNIWKIIAVSPFDPSEGNFLYLKNFSHSYVHWSFIVGFNLHFLLANVFYVILNSLYYLFFILPSPKASYWLFKLLLDTRQIFSPSYQSWLSNYFTMSSEPIRDYEKFRLFFPKCIILHLTKLNFICSHATQSPSLLSFAWSVS